LPQFLSINFASFYSCPVLLSGLTCYGIVFWIPIFDDECQDSAAVFDATRRALDFFANLLGTSRIDFHSARMAYRGQEITAVLFHCVGKSAHPPDQLTDGLIDFTIVLMCGSR
jgi:hypothetical protein